MKTRLWRSGILRSERLGDTETLASRERRKMRFQTGIKSVYRATRGATSEIKVDKIMKSFATEKKKNLTVKCEEENYEEGRLVRDIR